MVQLSITIDDNNKVTVNQSATPTKVEKKSTIADKTYFIIMRNFDKSSWPELVTEDFQEALFTKKELEKNGGFCYSYRIFVQKNGSIVPCNGADFDIDSL